MNRRNFISILFCTAAVPAALKIEKLPQLIPLPDICCISAVQGGDGGQGGGYTIY